jgi:hypothetical protein
MEEGTEESSSPKVAATELAGVGQNHQATVGRLGLHQRGAREREGERVRESSVGWVGLTDPDPGLVGPVGQMGWLGLWAKTMSYSFSFSFYFSNFN